MRKSVLVVFGFLMLASCQKETKTGFVENSKLINDYQKKKDIEAKYQSQIDVFNKKVDSIGKAFQTEAQSFQQKATTMSQEDAQKQYQVLGQKQQMLQQQFQAEEQQIQKASQTAIDTLISEVRAYVKDYGKKEGYTYILGGNEAGSVLYGKDDKNLTKVILEALNKAYKKDSL